MADFGRVEASNRKARVNPFGVDYFGKQDIDSRHGICGGCRKLTVLSSYTTGRFFHFRQLPLIPLGRVHVVDECPRCGQRGLTSNRKFRKQRSRDLAAMMEGFNKEPDNPDTALNGLQTLMAYNEERWFMDLQDSYGRRFNDHMQVQLVIAQGLCRFSQYADAEIYCRKAIVLGAGPRAEELLARCQTLRERSNDGNFKHLAVQPESMLHPYAFLITNAVLLIGILLFNGISAMHHHNAWVVNGSPVRYSVEIDGKPYSLKPYSSQRITLRLGKHMMQPHGLPGRTHPIPFKYTTSLLKQKLENHALVLNPDAMALLVEKTWLAEGSTNHYRIGKAVNELSGIDQPFSSSFSIWSPSKRKGQTRLFMHQATNHLDTVEIVLTNLGEQAATTYARRVLQIEPTAQDAPALLKRVVKHLPAEKAVDFLKQGRNEAMPRLQWHLFYQDYMAIHHPGHNLQTEYALLCECYPSEPLYYYLLGRVVHDRSNAKMLFEKSEHGRGCNGLGYQAIAHELLCRGQFSEALPYSEKALDRDPNNLKFDEINMQIHLAMRQYEPILFRIRKILANDPTNSIWVARQIKCLTLAGEHQAAVEAASNYPNAAPCWGAYFNAARYYAVGNMDDYKESMAEAGIVEHPLQLPLMNNEVEAAHALLAQNEDHVYTAHLIMYCAAQCAGQAKIATTEMTKALAEIAPTNYDSKKIHAFLADQTPPRIGDITALRIMPREKAILCATLAFRFPEHQAAYFRLMQTFNHTPEYPQLLLKKWAAQAAHAH